MLHRGYDQPDRGPVTQPVVASYPTCAVCGSETETREVTLEGDEIVRQLAPGIFIPISTTTTITYTYCHGCDK